MHKQIRNEMVDLLFGSVRGSGIKVAVKQGPYTWQLLDSTFRHPQSVANVR